MDNLDKENNIEESNNIEKRVEEEKNELIEKCKKASNIEISEMAAQIESYDEEGKKIIKDEVKRRNNIVNNKLNIEEVSINIEKNIKVRLYYFVIMCSIFYISAILMLGIEETIEMLFSGRNIRMIILFSVLADVIYIRKNKLKGEDAKKIMSMKKLILLALATLLLSNDFSIFEMD